MKRLHLTAALAATTFHLLNASAVYGASPRTGSSLKSGALSTDLYFKQRVGNVEEHTIRSGPAAAHIYLEGGESPYLFFAFPQGNSGVALWFKKTRRPVNVTAIRAPSAVIVHDAKNKAQQNDLNGASIDLTFDTTVLAVEDSVLGSMRRVRDRELGDKTPPELQTKDFETTPRSLRLARRGLNDLYDYVMEIQTMGDTRVVGSGSKAKFIANKQIQLRVKGLTGEKPLTPIAPEEVFTPEALKAMNPDELRAFSFLLYREKMVAGAPRYLSKFGRDSLFTTHVLADLAKVVRPDAFEMLLNATLSSTNPADGRVSHEQHEGDFASWDRMIHKKEVRGINYVIEDYRMIDDNVAFALIMATYIKRYPQRAEAFLNGVDQRGLSRRMLIRNNFNYVYKAAMPFANKPVYSNLVRIEKGERIGNWRDSVNGLGGGVYPFDVNVAFMPGALKAMSEAYSLKGSSFYSADRAQALAGAFKVWNEKAPELFMIRFPPDYIKRAATLFARDLGIDQKVVPPIPDGFEFPAISLDESGQKVPIVHSDDSLMMVFGFPSKRYLRGVAQRLLTQFPYGLATPVGILVANPVFADAKMKEQFDGAKYHGRVSWKMQEDMMVFGLDRQLEDAALEPDLRALLVRAREAVERVIDAKSSMGNTEVFQISYNSGAYQAWPFAGDAKSNSNQLWSHMRIGRTHSGTIMKAASVR